VQNLVSSDEPIFQPWQQGYCLSAAEVAAIIAGQYMPVPVQQQPPPSLPAGAFLGLCNEVTGPAITGQRNCAWGAGLGQYCTGGGSADHHQLELSKNTTTAAAANAVAREVAHEDSTKLGLLPYCFGDSTAVDAASVAATSPLAATPDAAVTVASVAASTAGLAGLPASTVVPNGVVASYDLLQLQGMMRSLDYLGASLKHVHLFLNFFLCAQCVSYAWTVFVWIRIVSLSHHMIIRRVISPVVYCVSLSGSFEFKYGVHCY
jgi:hypothetical protein